MSDIDARQGGCSCCGRGTGLRQRSVSEYFDLGRSRMRRPPLACQGDARRAADGVTARFSLELGSDRIKAVSFDCSLCFTLVAFCELLAEIVEGLTLREAVQISAAQLAAQMPGVPTMKRDRAALALQALLSSVEKAVLGKEKRKEERP